MLITNTAASTAYFKLYDNPAAPTCSSAINLVQIIPVVAATTFQLMPPQGMYINSGLSFCIVGGPTDTDSSNGPAGVYVNISRQ